jgi:hypothetical protein
VRNKLPMLENLELQKYHRSLITSCSTTSCSTPLSNTGHGLRKKREKVEFLGNGSQFAGWGCTSYIHLTHSLKAPGFKPSVYQLISCFQILLSNSQLVPLQRGARLLASLAPPWYGWIPLYFHVILQCSGQNAFNWMTVGIMVHVNNLTPVSDNPSRT